MKKISTLFVFLFFLVGLLLGQVSEGFDSATFPPTGWTVYSTSGATWTRITSSTRNSSAGAASSGNPSGTASKHLTVSLNISSTASSITYYVSVSSMQHGSGARLTIQAGSDTTSLTTLRTILLDSSSVFSVANTYLQFTDNIDGTTALGQTGSLDLRSTNPAYIRWTHQKDSGTSPSCRLEDISIPNASALPVELTSFNAIVKGRNVELKWNTATEVNNFGFEVEKITVSNRLLAISQELINNSWSKIGFVEGNGTTNSPKSYNFVDANASGKVAYRLKQIDRDGKFEYSKTVEVNIAAPKTFSLEQNYPNPFNPTTTISYRLSANSFTTLKVYDALGREVATLVNEQQEAGSYSVKFSAEGGSASGGNVSNLASGIYFYRLESGKSVAIKKLLLLK